MRYETISVETAASAARVVELLARPETLPEWAFHYCRAVASEGEHTIIEMNDGQRNYYAPRADLATGVVDLYSGPTPEPTDYLPMRVLPLGDDRSLAAAAVAGDRSALEELIYRHQAWIYNIALRMVWEPAEAEDVTQEALLKIVTKLSTYRGDSSFRTWLYRIVANHVLNMKRRTHEQAGMSFEKFGQGLAQSPDSELPDPKSVPVELPVLVEEAKLGCTMAMPSQSPAASTHPMPSHSVGLRRS